MRALPSYRRRPELILLAALLALAVIVAWRWLQSETVPASVGVAGPAPASAELGDPQTIARFQEQLRQNPNDAKTAAALGLGLLQRSRETADSSLYAQAEQAFNTALRSEPEQLEALIGQGSLALSRHQFAEALTWGERARTAAPRLAAVYGILTDAYVELGRYDEAVVAAQQMVDIRPDLSSYSRVSYLRELYGDMPGAIEAMEFAVDAGAPGAENSSWTRVQLGNLHFGRGDLERAQEQFQITLAERPSYPYAEAGLARVLAAQGRLDEAARRYEAVVARLPLPEFAVALGELYEAMGRPNDATRLYDLVRAIQQLNAGAGVDVDMELALFDLDHGDNPTAALAAARIAYERRPSIYAADTLAWALSRAGEHEEAARHSVEALRLGTQDAAMLFRAGMIAYAGGDNATARTRLQAALDLNPHFSPLRAAQARQILAELP